LFVSRILKKKLQPLDSYVVENIGDGESCVEERGVRARGRTSITKEAKGGNLPLPPRTGVMERGSRRKKKKVERSPRTLGVAKGTGRNKGNTEAKTEKVKPAKLEGLEEEWGGLQKERKIQPRLSELVVRVKKERENDGGGCTELIRVGGQKGSETWGLQTVEDAGEILKGGKKKLLNWTSSSALI